MSSDFHFRSAPGSKDPVSEKNIHLNTEHTKESHPGESRNAQSVQSHFSYKRHTVSAPEDETKKKGTRTSRIAGRGSEARSLILKLVFILATFFVIFTFIFGLHRNLSAGMQPSLRDGDLIFYYRLDKNYLANNIIMFKYKDELIASRVIAIPGDTVDITDKGLEINGHIMYEPEIYSKTTQFRGGPTFPLKVEPNTVFVLGDNREHANDSRIIGLIKFDDIEGKVMGIIRRRNL